MTSSVAARPPLLAAVTLVVAAAGAAAQTSREGHTVTLNGFEMYYETVGEGAPLVLLHGWSGTGHDYDPFIDAFAEHYRLILPDLRGHGRSTNPGGAFTMHQAALDVLGLLDHLGLERVRAVGASMGGITWYHVATQQPSRIERLVVIGAGNTFLPHCRSSMAATSADTYPQEWWRQMRMRHRYGDEQIEAIADMLPRFAADETDVAFASETLATISAPTLLIFGDRDWCFPVSMAVEIYEAIPDAALWVVPHGGHVPITGEHAPRFIETVLAFLGNE